MAVKKKRSATAIRTARNKEKYREHGLTEIKVWTHRDEAPLVREQAANNPKTKRIRKKLKQG